MTLTTPPTTCTKCARPILWTDGTDVEKAAAELYEATRYPWQARRAHEAIGAAGAHLQMLASMISGVCIVCHLTARHAEQVRP